jgi:hypothetical protein
MHSRWGRGASYCEVGFVKAVRAGRELEAATRASGRRAFAIEAMLKSFNSECRKSSLSTERWTAGKREQRWRLDAGYRNIPRILRTQSTGHS